MKLFLFASFILMALLGASMHAQPQTLQQHVIILIGPPGSGKGTQGVQLAKVLSIPHISTGDLLRENIKNKTLLGDQAKGYMDAGKFVPDDVVLNMLFARIEQPDSRKGFLLDGFPRTLVQAEALDKFIERSQAKVIVFNLEVPDEVIVERAAGRLSCSTCGNVLNKKLSSTSKEGICDKCSGFLVQRPDDQPEVVLERLKIYHSQTKPLIAYYENQKVLSTFDGTLPIEDVFSQLMKRYRELAE